jgi:hypothetical protein
MKMFSPGVGKIAFAIFLTFYFTVLAAACYVAAHFIVKFW